MTTTHKTTISGGVYLVLNPAVEQNLLLTKLESALKGHLQAVQIWNNWLPASNKLLLIASISKLCKPYNVPLFINNDWMLLKQTQDIDGVHFDTIPALIDQVRTEIGRPFLCGITCSGNLDTVVWAEANQLDYISFCSMFPSSSAGTCEIVMPETVGQARTMTRMPIFIAGGITPENTQTLKQQIPFNGVAVISGILSADDPEQKVQEYQQALITI